MAVEHPPTSGLFNVWLVGLFSARPNHMRVYSMQMSHQAVHLFDIKTERPVAHSEQMTYDHDTSLLPIRPICNAIFSEVPIICYYILYIIIYIIFIIIYAYILYIILYYIFKYLLNIKWNCNWFQCTLQNVTGTKRPSVPQQLDFQSTILTRFDLIFKILDPRDRRRDEVLQRLPVVGKKIGEANIFFA